MKLRILADELRPALAAAGRAVSAKSYLPVLAGVLLEADGDGLSITATDTERTLALRVPAAVDEPGRIVLPAKLLAGYVALLPDGSEIALEARDRERAILRSGHSSTSISGFDPDDFPPFPAVEDATVAELDAAALKAAVGSVEHAAASDDSRPALAGILLRPKDGSLVLAAADGYRLAVREMPLADGVGLPELIVPAAVLRDLARMLPDAGTVELVVSPSGTRALFRFGTTRLATRLIEGQFPDYERIVPRESPTACTVEVAALVRAAKTAGLFRTRVDGQYGPLVQVGIFRLHLAPPDRLVVSAASAEGDHEAALEAKVEGPELRLGLNARYLLAALDALDGGRVWLGCSGSTSPVLVRDADAAGDGRFEVLMPMHIREDAEAKMPESEAERPEAEMVPAGRGAE